MIGQAHNLPHNVRFRRPPERKEAFGRTFSRLPRRILAGDLHMIGEKTLDISPIKGNNKEYNTAVCVLRLNYGYLNCGNSGYNRTGNIEW